MRGNKKNLDSSYMTMGLNTTQIAKDCLQAAIHSYDKTARPHIPPGSMPNVKLRLL